MFAICVESSHRRGMGHLFRQINFASLLAEKGEQFVFLVNNDPSAFAVLAKKKIQVVSVDLADDVTGWEIGMIKRFDVKFWVDDRLDTSLTHARRVKESGVSLTVFDDCGPGAGLADFNFSGLCFEGKEGLRGKNVFTGTDYLILNREIDLYRRVRHSVKKIIVTLGGSDTYGATVKVIELLRSAGLAATVITGPSFKHFNELMSAALGEFEIKPAVDSLIAEFNNYDLAVTGGGVTPFEANACGLPCIIIANEHFEIPSAKYLESIGASVFAGHHERINLQVFDNLPDVSLMSKAGLSTLNTKGAEKIYNIIVNG